MTSPAPRPPVAAYAAAGSVVAGRYVLSRRIAGGGMGDVWRAHDQVRDRAVALKLLRPEYLDEPAFLARFRAEARLAGLLDHPGIAAVHDYGENDGPGGVAWLVMELVEGEPLSRLLARRGALPPEQALDVIGQTACALQAAHDAGVIHRDVKPANLLVRPDGVVKITDFGIARAAGAAPLTRTGTVLGTAHYLSPEQVQGRSASTASDVYALGIVAYECLAGRRPFEGDSPVQVALAHQRDPVPALPADLPGPVVALVMRALAKNPADRPTSAGSLGRTALGIRAALYITDEAADSPGSLAATVAVPAAVSAPATEHGTTPASQPTTASPTVPDPAPRTGTLPVQRGPGFSRPGPSRPGLGNRGGRLPQLVLLALVIAVVIAAIVHAAASGPTHTPAAHTKPATAPASTSIVVNPATYHGKPAASVIASLSALGLAPTRVDTAAEGAPGTVVTIVGSDGGPLPATLQRGAAVRVEVVAASTAASSGNGLDEGRN
jgi:serine/threonine protein kinase